MHVCHMLHHNYHAASPPRVMFRRLVNAYTAAMVLSCPLRPIHVALTMETVLLTIQALLSSPNPDDPLNEDAAKQWKENEDDALMQARRLTLLYASRK